MLCRGLVCTFLTSSTDRMLRMHSLASSRKSHSLISTSGAHNVFWESGSFYLMLLAGVISGAAPQIIRSTVSNSAGWKPNQNSGTLAGNFPSHETCWVKIIN